MGISIEGAAVGVTTPDSDAPSRIEQELTNSILQEIHDEVNIPYEQLTPTPQFLSVVYQAETQTPTLAYVVECTLTKTEIEACYVQGPKEQFESKELLFLELSESQLNLKLDLTPAAAGCLEDFYHTQTKIQIGNE